MDVKKRAKIITEWINNYCDSSSYKPKALVVGISGGIDSSVVSTLCANTGKKTIVLTMPIKQIKSQHDLSLSHAKWLKQKYNNVEHHLLEMDKIFTSFSEVLNKFDNVFSEEFDILCFVVFYIDDAFSIFTGHDNY